MGVRVEVRVGVTEGVFEGVREEEGVKDGEAPWLNVELVVREVVRVPVREGVLEGVTEGKGVRDRVEEEEPDFFSLLVPVAVEVEVPVEVEVEVPVAVDVEKGEKEGKGLPVFAEERPGEVVPFSVTAGGVEGVKKASKGVGKAG